MLLRSLKIMLLVTKDEFHLKMSELDKKISDNFKWTVGIIFTQSFLLLGGITALLKFFGTN